MTAACRLVGARLKKGAELTRTQAKEPQHEAYKVISSINKISCAALKFAKGPHYHPELQEVGLGGWWLLGSAAQIASLTLLAKKRENAD